MMKKLLLSTVAIFIISFGWSQNVNVTFQVDMTNVTGFTTPEVNGTFNGWCGNCNAMTYTGSNNIWSVTVNIPANTTYEYKFSHDSWAGQESLTSGTACTVTNFGFTNRQIVVGATDVTVPVVCWGSCNSCAAPPRAVTFRVDLSNINGFTTPTVNGSFNGWSGTANPLSDPESDGIWEATVFIPDGNYEYKFAYDNWTGQETLIPGSSCTVTNSGFTNRSLVVSADVILPVVCWNSCSTCAATLLPKDVTFKVDMQNVTGFTTAYVNGSFNGWCGSCNPMTDANNDGVWETTIQLNQDTFEYKFTYDGWTGQENLTPGSPCTSTLGGFTNRSIIVGNANQVLPIVCWESCTNCTPPTRNITFKVDMSQVTGFNPAVNVPTVNGSWDGWLGGSNPMTDANNDGVWEKTIALVDGSYEYKFAYDGWNVSENLVSGSSCTVTNGGFTNRSLTVNGIAQVLNPVCWQSCNTCSAPTYSVTFRVNMANETNFTTPYVSGTFNAWCGDCNAMSDANNDGVYEVTIPLQNGNYEYKISKDNWAGSEQLPAGSACTVTNSGFTNRTLVVNSAAQTLPVTCYGSCSDCQQLVNVTFQVNMEQVTGYNIPEVNGSFNGWCGGCFQLTDANNDNIWVGTAAIAPGTYEFKYAYDSWAGSENLIPGLPCTVTNFGFTNRQLVITGDTVLPVSCWAACSECLSNYNVTFQVDMSNVSGFSVPEVNGDFNGWCGGCFQLTDPDGNGIYTGTASIQEGMHEFKFAYDGWAGQESLTSGSPCTVTNFGFTNRSINVTQNITLPVVCYGSCSGCTYAVSNDSPYSATSFNYNVNQNYPNCDPLSNTLAGCTDSPQSASVGPDRWYKFIAQSTAVSITLSSASQDDFIELYSRTGNTFTLLDSENASAGNGDYEKLNYSGLTIGNVYYISIGGSVNGAFTLCIQHLLRSWGAYSQPASGFQLCSNYKCVYRGNSSNSVSYTFNFTETGGTETAPFETTSASTSSTYIALNNPVLALQYGGIYNVQVDALYNLTNSAGAPNPITIPGLITDPNSTGVTMGNHSLLEVRSSQRCPASLFRGTYLNGARVGGANPVCGALNYTYEFQQVASCNDGSTVGLASTFTNSSSSPYLQLGVLPTGVNAGAWDVRIKPNFSYGSGTYGPAQRIRVNGTAAGTEIIEESAISEREEYINETSVYPNPSDGNTLNVRATNLKNEVVQIRIIDALGKMVWSNSLFNSGDINTTINFNETLSPGVYNLEIMDGNEAQTSRLIVQ